jgi:hypothetical protein
VDVGVDDDDVNIDLVLVLVLVYLDIHLELRLRAVLYKSTSIENIFLQLLFQKFQNFFQ